MTDKLNIEEICIGLPGITPVLGAHMHEGCVVCLNKSNHSSGVNLQLRGDQTASIKLEWNTPYTDQMDRGWQDQEVATEHGAVCISALLALNLTEYTIVSRSRKGTGIDYWLGKKDNILFQNAARLEVSGIFNGQDKVEARVAQKKKRIDASPNALPAYVSIVEFSEPSATFVKKCQ